MIILKKLNYFTKTLPEIILSKINIKVKYKYESDYEYKINFGKLMKNYF